MDNINKILLVGNPNVGKSAIFSRLTGARVMISNYPGTTVEFTQGYMKVGEARPVVIDVPGTYTLEPASKAEEVAREMMGKDEDVIINVVDATNLERNLFLTLELIEKVNKPMIVALNMWDDTKHRGIDIDVKKLEEFLRVPVVPTCGITGEGIKALVDRLPEARAPRVHEHPSSQRWEYIGKALEHVQKLSHRHHTFLEMLQDASVRPVTAFPIAAFVIFLSFQVVRFVAESLIGYVIEPFFEHFYTPIIMRLSAILGPDTLLHDVLVGKLIGGEIDFGQSFGLLTTGIFVPIGAVLPYIFSFYLVLGVLEDLGYLPRLAILVDNLMHRLGLHGYAIIPMVLGLGCNVPGALAMRLLEGKREKFIAATLMAIAVPCMAQIAMIVGLVGARGGQYLGIIFLTLFIVWLVLGLILNRFLKGKSPEILIEIPPYRMPQLQAVIKKLWMRLVGFLREALPLVLLGVLIVNVLYALRIIDFFANIFSPIVTKLWGLPQSAISALLVGFLRKDVAVGMLGPLDLTTKQLVIGCTILAIYFPCFATFMVLVRELGLKDMLKSLGIMLSVALAVGTILRYIL